MEQSNLKDRLFELEHRSGFKDLNDVFTLFDDLFELAKSAITELDKVQGQLAEALKKLDQDHSVISILENNID